jgi:class 3 adenylate cyclase
MDCGACGASNPDGNRFCGDCAAPLPQRCGSCGAENPPGKRFCGHCAASLATATLQAGESTPDASASPNTEFRHVSVMFCDLVGSTALSSHLDPEDYRDVVMAYQERIAALVDKFGGFIACYQGDGVLIYFGWPTADETDAERAVRAGLAMIESVCSAPIKGQKLQVRVGIASGPVIIGDLVGTGSVQQLTVLGETPNLASRLQTLAEPETVVICLATRVQIGGLFDCRDLGPIEMKGFDRPLHAWRVLAETSSQDRFKALRSSALTPLVGRDDELHFLLRRWEQVKQGDGRCVLISGEPGIGKSRLIAALTERVSWDNHTHLRYFCSPHHQDSALYPVIGQLEHAAAFERDELAEGKLGKLRALLVPTDDPDQDLALVADLLSLPAGSHASTLNFSPKRKRDMTLAALYRQLEGLSKTRPILIIVEDAHWADPSTVELLGLIVDRLQGLPVLLVVTYRPEFRPPWINQIDVVQLTLSRLGRRQAAMIAAKVSRVAGAVELPDETLDRIVDHADGVPLFIEELTKGVLESGSATRDGSTALAVPRTLQASLMARLDRLPTAKQIAQVGAVIGRKFTHELLAAVAPIAEPALQRGLDQLVASGLVAREGDLPQASYLFKHALVQDTAYGTLLRARRQELHGRVATVLERSFGELIGRQPELLAYHLAAAGKVELAVGQWLKAGQHAAARSAHIEAVSHFNRGLTALAELPPGTARDGLEIDLQLARGPSLFAARGFAAPEAADAYARARELAEPQGNVQQVFAAVNGLWQSANGAGKVLECRKLSTRLRELAADTADDALRLQAYHSAWATCLFSGEPEAARDHCLEGHRLYDPERHNLNHQLYGGHDPGSCAYYLGAQANWLLGHSEKGLAQCHKGLALAEHSGHPFSIACALQYFALLHLERGEPELALQRLEAAESLVADQGLGFVLDPQLLRSAAARTRGAFDEAAALAREGLAGRATRLRCYGLANLSEALSRQGKYGAALEAAKDGLVTVQTTAHRQWEAELHRLEGVAQLGLGRVEEGEGALEAAIRVARSQRARAYELRAATALARSWGERRRRPEARELLFSVQTGFSEGFDTADLKEAKALLDSLA